MIRRKITPGLSSIGSPGGYQKKSFSSEFPPSPIPASPVTPTSPVSFLSSSIPNGSEESPGFRGQLSPQSTKSGSLSPQSPKSESPSPLSPRSRKSGSVSPLISPHSLTSGSLSPQSPHSLKSLSPDDGSGRVFFGSRWPNDKHSYRLEDVIGFGSSAVVHSGFCLPRGEKCAIKRINLEQSKASMEEILKEIHVMVTCAHPNVVSYYTSFVVEDELWIVMKLHEGGSLLDVIKQTMRSRDTTHGVLDEETIATVVREVLQGLAYLHKSGQIHRDIKAGNILVGKDGSVQIADFGVSACLSGVATPTDRARKFTFVGTPCWMSPEVVESNGVGYDFKTDIWSLGITVIEMVRGTAPYMNYPPIKILMLVIQDESPKLETGANSADDFKNYGKSIRNFISLCLTKDPAKRPTAAQLLKHPFLKKARDKDFLRAKFAQVANTPNPPKVPRKHGRRTTDDLSPTTAQWDWNADAETIATEDKTQEKSVT